MQKHVVLFIVSLNLLKYKGPYKLSIVHCFGTIGHSIRNETQVCLMKSATQTIELLSSTFDIRLFYLTLLNL